MCADQGPDLDLVTLVGIHDRGIGVVLIDVVVERIVRIGEGFFTVRTVRGGAVDLRAEGRLAVEAWGQGYMSEVVQAVVRYTFEGLALNRLFAYHMLRNPASGRVLEKNGFKQEGLLRQRVKKWGRFEDVALCALLRQEWLDTLGK